MATPLLQINHYPRQLLEADLVPVTQLADGIILAETTGQIAVSEEDGARTTSPGNRGLLPVMGIKAGYAGQKPTTALAHFPRAPIHPAPPGAEHAGLQQPISLLNPSPKLCFN
jgi:hypothetical protein